jgi:hypothetical protein
LPVLRAQLAQVRRQQELEQAQAPRQQAPVQAPRQQEQEQEQVLVLVPPQQEPVQVQQHHWQPPRRQSQFQRAQCHLPAREFPSAFRQSVTALRCLLCLLTPQTVVRQLLQHHPHF